MRTPRFTIAKLMGTVASSAILLAVFRLGSFAGLFALLPFGITAIIARLSGGPSAYRQEKRDIANIDDCQSLTGRCSGHPGRSALNFALSGGRSAVDIKVLDPPEGHVIARGSYLGGPDYEFVVWHDGQVYSASRSPVREVEALKSRPTCRRTTSRPWVGSRSRSHSPRP